MCAFSKIQKFSRLRVEIQYNSFLFVKKKGKKIRAGEMYLLESVGEYEMNETF